MKINNINSTNFNGIYRLKNTVHNVKELEEKVMPIYQYVRHEKIAFFIGTNPFKDNLLAAVKHTADVNGASVDWLKTNAKNHDLDITDLGDDVIHVVTGDKDILGYNNFLAKRLIYKPKISAKIAKLIEAAKQKLNLPEHLKPLVDEIIPDKEEDKAFAEFAPQITDVDSPYELLKKAFAEK